MPARPAWHARVPDILEILRRPASSTGRGLPPVLDRASFENLFQVSRRQAVRLMRDFGGYQSGKTFLVERDVLIDRLVALTETGSVTRATERRQRILDSIRFARREDQARKVSVPAPADVTPPSSLPRGVERVGSGCIQIRYSSATELLSRIVDLATSAAGDFENFQRQVEG